MTPDQHLAKAERIANSLAKLTTADYELVIEAAMLAGTHWFNAAAHRHGITSSDDDVMNVEYLPRALRVKISLIAPGLTELVEEIEQFRPIFVKGNVADGEAAAKRCGELLDHLRDRARTAQRPPGLATYNISTKGLAYRAE